MSKRTVMVRLKFEGEIRLGWDGMVWDDGTFKLGWRIGLGAEDQG